MRVDKETISPLQKRMLEIANDVVQRERFSDELVEIFRKIVCDGDIESGRESIHPDWMDLFEKSRNKLKKMLGSSNELFISMEEFFRKMSPVDPSVGDLDPSKDKVCFLLGAGASRPDPSSIPTVRELLPDMLERARRLDREDVAKLADFCGECEIENIEDLLTAAQVAAFCSRNPNVLSLVDFLLYGERRNQLRDPRFRRQRVDLSSVAFLQDTLQVLFGLLSSRMLPAQPNAAHESIVEYAKSNPKCQIITTNYDCCMDLALLCSGVSFDYGLEFINRGATNGIQKGGIALTKLHGSLNWFYCETCQDVMLIDIKDTVEDFLKDKKPYPVIAVCRKCGGQCRPLLVPPLAIKFDIAPPLTRLLEHVNKAFQEAKLIVVVGFSFAEADIYISRTLSKSMQTKKEQKLLIIDPDSSLVDRIQRKFAASIPDFDPDRVLGIRDDCAGVLPKFLRGEMKRTVEMSELDRVKHTKKSAAEAIHQ